MLLFRHLLEKRGIRTPEDVLPLYREAAKQLDSRTAEPAAKTVEGWFYYGRRPQRAFREVIVAMLGRSIDQLWSEVPEGNDPELAPLTDVSPTAPHANAGADLSEMRRTGSMAVQRARQFLLGKDQGAVGEETLGLLDDEVERLVAAYPREPLSVIWDDLLVVQEQIFRLLEGGRVKQLSHLRDLNFKASILSFLVAKGFNDMQAPYDAMTMTRVAASCARTCEHQGLIALTDGLKSLIAYWADKPADAYHYARQGSANAANLNGTVGLWLLGLEARAAALLGDEETVLRLNREADGRRETVVFDDLDRLGGLFSYASEKQQYYAVEAEVHLGRGTTDLIARAEGAVEGFSDPNTEAWAFGDLAGSQCNLALVHLSSGDVEGAADAIGPVLELQPGFRNKGIIVSALRVRQALVSGPGRSSVAGRALSEEIEAFPGGRTALPRG